MVRELLLLRLVGWQTANMQHIHPTPNTHLPALSKSRLSVPMPAQVWSDFIFQFFFMVISYHDLFLSYFLPWRQSPTPRREKGEGRRVLYLIVRSTLERRMQDR